MRLVIVASEFKRENNSIIQNLKLFIQNNYLETWGQSKI